MVEIRRTQQVLVFFCMVWLLPGVLYSSPLSSVFNKERSVEEDIIFFQNGDILRGDILDKFFVINTAYASLKIQSDQCAGVAFDKVKSGFATILTVNCNRITGYQDRKTIRFNLSSSGTTVDIPVNKVSCLLFKLRLNENNSNRFGELSNLFIMNNGDTLTGKLANDILEMDTGYGQIPIAISEVTELVFPDELMSKVSLLKKNGDKVTGQLKTMTFTIFLNINTQLKDIYQDKIIKIITGIGNLKSIYRHEFNIPSKNEKYKSRTVFSKNEYKNGLGMTFHNIRPGRFYMGSPVGETGRNGLEKRHLVILEKPFFIQTTEVTQKQWMSLMGHNPSSFKGPDRPVENVSWFDVQTFISKLNAIDKTLHYRLPTEAEWEYAARAGNTGKYCFGDNSSELQNYAWFEGNSRGETHAVAQKRPNAWGLFDMHGNVWEWCRDRGRWNKGVQTPTFIQGIINPFSTEGEDRINRGGSFSFHQRFCRSSSRYCNAPGSRKDSIGFRLTGHINK